MKIAVMPGSFDPFTIGHADMLVRACGLFDYVYVGVLVNVNKAGAFTLSERVAQIKKVISELGLKNADAESFEGLLTDFIKKKNACAVVRGLRSLNDFQNELTQFDINKRIAPDTETVCLFSKPELACISSSTVKELCSFGYDISGLVPDCIYKEIRERLCRE